VGQPVREAFPLPRRQLIISTVLACAGLLLLTLAVTRHVGPLISVDARISAAAYRAAVDHPGWRAGMYAVTWTANTTTITPVVALVTLLLIWRRRWRQGCFLVGAMLATAGVRLIILNSVDRPRPVDQLAPSAGWSFPSGHTTAAASAALAAVIVCWPKARAHRGRALLLISLAGGWALAVGVSRVALVVHWPSDVVGAWLLTATVVPTVAVLAHVFPGSTPKPKRAAAPAPALTSDDEG
jgi:undecaprenyl-diphosphatase